MIDDMKAFLAIAETGSISKAAELLNLAQSTVSHRLKMLEQELDVKLFVRGKGVKSVELTEGGIKFLPYAEKWAVLWEDCQHIHESETSYPLAIGCIESLNAYVFPPFYNQLISHSIPFILDIQTHHTYQIYSELDKRTLDIGLSVSLKQNPNIVSEPLFSEKMQIVTRYDYGPGLLCASKLSPENELEFNWDIGYKNWHNHFFDSTIPPKARMDMILAIAPILFENENAWVCTPSAIARFLQKMGPVRIYDLEVPPPDRICYKLTNRHPRYCRLGGIMAFNTLLTKFLEENDLKL